MSRLKAGQKKPKSASLQNVFQGDGERKARTQKDGRDGVGRLRYARGPLHRAVVRRGVITTGPKHAHLKHRVIGCENTRIAKQSDLGTQQERKDGHANFEHGRIGGKGSARHKPET